MAQRPTSRAGRAAAFLLALSLALSARADIVHLKSGNMVEGDVSPGSQPGSIRVVLDKGLEIEFPQKDVLEIEKKKSPAKEFDEKLAAIPPGDVDALLLLAEWARERMLRSREEGIYRKVLEIDPDDPVSRRELGYAVYKNRWVKEAELRSKRGLIQFRGDWIAPDEKERRIQEELKKEISDLLRDVDSENRYIREYSVKKLMEYRDPRVRSVIIKFLDDPRDAVRVVAAQLLAALEDGARGKSGKGAEAGKSGGKGGKGPAAPAGPKEEEVAKALFDRVLNEENRTVRVSLANAVQKIHSRKIFDLALEAIRSSPNPLHRDRAAEGLLFGIRKDWVPELIRALPKRPGWAAASTAGNPQIKSILARLFREDFGYSAADWDAWWTRNKGRYMDED